MSGIRFRAHFTVVKTPLIADDRPGWRRGIAEINVKKLENGFPLEFESPFTPGDTFAKITIKPIDNSMPATFLIEVIDICGNVNLCDPVFFTASANGPAQYTFSIFSIDKYLYVNNDGLTGIEMRINEQTLELIADPVRRDRRGHRQYMPVQGDISVDIASYVTEDENPVILSVTGPAAASAQIFFTDVELPTLSSPLPQDFALYQNYPNPFNPSTTVEYTVPEIFKEGIKVELLIYNLFGQKVKTLVDKQEQPGVYPVSWDGRDDFGRLTASGIYIYRIKVGKFVATKRMTLIK